MTLNYLKKVLDNNVGEHARIYLDIDDAIHYACAEIDQDGNGNYYCIFHIMEDTKYNNTCVESDWIYEMCNKYNGNMQLIFDCENGDYCKIIKEKYYGDNNVMLVVGKEIFYIDWEVQ